MNVVNAVQGGVRGEACPLVGDCDPLALVALDLKKKIFFDKSSFGTCRVSILSLGIISPPIGKLVKCLGAWLDELRGT